MRPVVAKKVTAVLTWKVPTSDRNSPTKPLVPGKPTEASMNTMKTAAYCGMVSASRPQRHLDGEGGEEGEPQPSLEAPREVETHRRRDVGRADLVVDRQDGEQHQHRAQERIEEELEGGVDAPRPAPHADDEEHRDEH